MPVLSFAVFLSQEYLLKVTAFVLHWISVSCPIDGGHLGEMEYVKAQ